jgi:hypothetical protein
MGCGASSKNIKCSYCERYDYIYGYYKKKNLCKGCNLTYGYFVDSLKKGFSFSKKLLIFDGKKCGKENDEINSYLQNYIDSYKVNNSNIVMNLDYVKKNWFDIKQTYIDFTKYLKPIVGDIFICIVDFSQN